MTKNLIESHKEKLNVFTSNCTSIAWFARHLLVLSVWTLLLRLLLLMLLG